MFKVVYSPAWYCSPFLSSNDHIDYFNDIVTHLQSQTNMELVSVIGGLKFFDFLEKLDFQRVTLFDKNINEVVKFILAYDYLQKTELEDFDHFISVSKFIEKNLIKGILSPEKFPHFQWKPTNYDRVKRAKFNSDIYLDFPKLDAEGRLVVVFLSHCNIPFKLIKNRIAHASSIIPVYARPRKHDGKGFFQKKRVNGNIAQPHTYWSATVDKYKVGKSIHVWPPEKRHMAGGVHDKQFTKGIGCFAFLKMKEKYDTVVTHIFLGNSKHTREDRFHLLKLILAKAKFADRIIVTDYNKESGQFIDLPVLPSSQEIIDKVTGYVYPEFSVEVDYSAAGNRELVIICKKVGLQ